MIKDFFSALWSDLGELAHYFWHAFLEKLGRRRTGAFDQRDPRDYKFSELAGAPTDVLPSKVDLYNIFAQDQGQTNHCTGYSGAHCLSILETIRRKRKTTVEGIDVWNLQLEQGSADEDRGDFINSTPKAIVKYGIKTKRGETITYEKYTMINSSEFRESLANGIPIFTGTRINRPMTDSAWYFRPGGKKYGHAFLVVGYDDKAEHYYNYYSPSGTLNGRNT